MKRIQQKLTTFDRELTEKCFKIYGRSNVTTAILLAYCSPLRFSLQGMLLPRGWLDILLVGDTRCGKSAVAEQLVSNLQLGEFLTCENVSFAGLVGGLQQLGQKNKWDICWGKIPINNGKLLVADEMSSLSVETIGNMSGVRSSGVAEISKVQGGIARAACRMIWISNPRSDMDMSSYAHGVRSIPELIGRPEDIARFDFAIGLRRADVPLDVINSRRDGAETFDPNWAALRTLVKWVWRLKPADIEFGVPAIDAILNGASYMAKKYHASIPLVEPNEQRVKIARVAAATAARCFSEQGGRLIVKPEHVEFAIWFMESCFDSPSLMYDHYSKTMKHSTDMQMENMSSLLAQLNQLGIDGPKLSGIQYLDYFNPTDIEHILDIPRSDCRMLVSSMLRYGMIMKMARGYRKTPLGVQIMKDIAGGL